MSFARSLFTVSGLTLVSRVGGFIRDSLTAIFLGAGPVADAFFVAQRLPNLFRSLFAEGAFSAAFVPLYTTEQEQHGRDAAQQFAGQALMLLLAALIPFSVVVMYFMPYLMGFIAHGYAQGSEKYQLALSFCRITFPYLALISVTALQTGVLNARGRFGPGAAAPIALNIVMIFGLLVGHLFHLNVGYTLAWSVTLSGVVQCGWLMISCARAGASIPLLRPHLGEASRKLFQRIGPGALGAGMYQVNLLISQNFASTLPTGSMSYLFYADRLNQLPLGIVGTAIATTLLPVLSRHIAAGDADNVRRDSSRSIEFCLLLGLPAMVGLFAAAQPIVQTLFEHGRFTHADTVGTVAALQAYTLGIPGFLMVKVFAAGFFARQDTKTPVKMAIVAMGVNILCSYGLLQVMGHVGIALANGISVSVNAGLLYLALRRTGVPIGNDNLPRQVWKILICAAIMAGMTFLLAYLWDRLALRGVMIQGLGLGGLITLSGVSYAAALQSTGTWRWRDALALMRRKNIAP